MIAIAGRSFPVPESFMRRNDGVAGNSNFLLSKRIGQLKGRASWKKLHFRKAGISKFEVQNVIRTFWNLKFASRSMKQHIPQLRVGCHGANKRIKSRWIVITKVVHLARGIIHKTNHVEMNC